MRVGVVGLGAMGLRVAKRLLSSGFSVHGFDVREQALTELKLAGGRIATCARDIGMECDVILLFVLDEKQASNALFGPEGLVSGVQDEKVVVGCMTAPPAAMVELSARLKQHGVLFLESPVSGGVVGAERGLLTLMTSGDSRAFERSRPVLDAIAGRVYRLGESYGAASKVKLLNQLLVGVHIAASAEVMALAAREGVDALQFYDIVCDSAGNSWAFGDRVPRMICGDFEPATTALNVFVKDLGLVMDLARTSQFPVHLASTAFRLFSHAAASGLGHQDDTALMKIFPHLPWEPSDAGLGVESPPASPNGG